MYLKRLFVWFLLYAWVFAALGKPLSMQVDGGRTLIEGPHLSYRIAHTADSTWRTFPNLNYSILPLSPFEGHFFFFSQTGNDVVLEWPDNKIEYLEALVLNEQGDTCAQLQYSDQKGYSSFFFLKNQTLVLPHPVVGKNYEVYYRLSSHSPVYPICCVQDIVPFVSRFIKEYTWYGLLAGIVLMVFSLNLLFFISQQEDAFLWYALYTLSLGVFHWSYTGVGFQWVWPELYGWNRYSYMFASFLLLSFQYLYLYHYTKKLHPVPKRFIAGVILFRLAILAYSLWQPTFSKWHLLLDFLTLAFQLWLMAKVLLYKTVHGRLFMASISLLALGYLIFIASYYQWIETNYFTYNTVAIGGILELLLGVLALALRFKYLNDEKDKLQRNEIESLKSISGLKEQLLEETREKERIQREVNKELEIKIQARTQELAQKNEKLEELNQKLYDMSSQLDKQNWSLNKELQGDRLKLMWGKDIPFAEFKQTFPSDKHVYRFIADLKWQEGFVCKKCQSKEWEEGSQYQSRRCLSCKYEESVTAHTLFHGVKFSLVQALYISLHTVIHRDSLPVKHLAEEIELREATVWAFRKKTLERISHKSMAKGDVLKGLVMGSDSVASSF